MSKISRSRGGFSLLELSIVIIVMAILMIGLLNISIFLLRTSQKNITMERISTLETAIYHFVGEHGRLPYPATMGGDSEEPCFGVEKPNCKTGAKYLDNGNGLLYGAIPVRALDLPNSYAHDGWKNKFSYVVDVRAVGDDSFIGFDGGSITITNADGGVVTDRAIMVIISHGPNGNGAFRDGGQNPINKNLVDSKNAYSVNFDRSFISDVTQDGFDDMVTYETKYSLTTSAGLEEIGCGIGTIAKHELLGHEGDEVYWSDDDNVYCEDGHCDFGLKLPSSNACLSGSYPNHYFSINPNRDMRDGEHKPVVRCMQNGVWSGVMYECKPGCGDSNFMEVVASSGFSGDIFSLGDGHRYVGLGENYIVRNAGYLEVVCGELGIWRLK